MFKEKVDSSITPVSGICELLNRVFHGCYCWRLSGIFMSVLCRKWKPGDEALRVQEHNRMDVWKRGM